MCNFELPNSPHRALRWAAAVAAATLLLSACGSREAAAPAAAPNASSHFKVQLAWLANVQSAGEYVALAKGFYSDAGLDVSLMPGGPSGNPIQLVAGGSADIGVTYAPPLMLARNSGIPVKAFGAAMQRAPLAYFSLAKEGITSVEKFKGHKVGVQPGGEVFLYWMLEEHGMKPSDVSIVHVGSDLTALISGQVDIIASWEINLQQLAPLRAAGPLNELRLFDEGVKFQSNYYVATDATLATNSKNLAKFLDATSKGWKYAIDNPNEAFDILLKVNPALDRASELEELTNYLPDYVFGGAAKEHGWGWMDKQMWKGALAAFVKQKQITDAVTVDDVATWNILEKASHRATQLVLPSKHP